MQRKADELREQDGGSWEKYAYLFELTNHELVLHMQHRGHHEIGIPIEMSRRVIVSNGELRRAYRRVPRLSREVLEAP